MDAHAAPASDRDPAMTPGALPGLPSLSLRRLTEFDAMCCRAENLSEMTVRQTALALGHLERFLCQRGLSALVDDIGAPEMRAFILYLQERPRFEGHPLIRAPSGRLSPHAVNCYLRAIRAAWNRWRREGLVEHSPFGVVRIPRVPLKVMPALSVAQLQAFFNAIDTRTPEGFRDYAMFAFFLDTTDRLGEVIGLETEDVDIQAGRAKVLGKGRRERYVFFGATVRKLLWKYVNRYRPEPQLPRYDKLFLTYDGRPLTKNRVEARVKKYVLKAGITGVRVSPHTLRHTAITTLVRNGCDIFSVQAIAGHSSINTTRGYVNLNTDDVQAAHRRYSPMDNLGAAAKAGPARGAGRQGKPR